MAEYYAVLSRAVASLETSTPEARRAVYDKARNALIGQLKAIVPPLPTSEISRQRLELEEAIRRAEREATNAAGAPQRATTTRRPSPVPPPPPPQSPLPQSPPPEMEELRQPEPVESSSSPQAVFRRAIREAESRADGAVPIERAPVREEAYGDMEAEFHVSDRSRRAPPPEEPAAYVPPNYRAPRRAEPRPRLAPDYPWEVDAPQSEAVVPRRAPAPQLDSEDRAPRVKEARRQKGRDRDRDVEGDYEGRAVARPSRLPTILLLVLIVALVGGLTALGWWQRDTLSKLFADSASSGNAESVASAPSAPAPAAPAPTDDAAAPGKNGDRLLGGGNSIATTPGVRVVGDAGAPADAGASADAGAPVAAGAPADAANPANAPADVATAEQPQPPPAANQGGDAALVAQKAVLYEEPLDPTKAAAGVTQINAAVTWNYVTDDANGPSVIANLDVPERGLKIKLTIHKNSDKTLPASHLIEVIVNATSAFPGKGIGSVPRLVLKPSEDARGQPLIGATAKVEDGFFWIALSALPADEQNNMSMLKDNDWIDLPLVYDTGQRAILTFEKGTPGDRVLAQALTAWAG